METLLYLLLRFGIILGVIWFAGLLWVLWLVWRKPHAHVDDPCDDEPELFL